MWCYMLTTLTKDKIEKKLRQCHIDFIAFKYEITGGGGGGGGTNDTPYMDDLVQERRTPVR